MGRQSAAYRTTGAGSTTLPAASLYGSSTGGIWLVQVTASNSTAVAVAALALRRLTTTGTQGASQTVQYQENEGNFTAKGDARDTHTVAPTVTAGAIDALDLGGSIGSGVAFTYGGRGLWIPSGVANGVGLMPLTGAGQILTVGWTWDTN